MMMSMMTQLPTLSSALRVLMFREDEELANKGGSHKLNPKLRLPRHTAKQLCRQEETKGKVGNSPAECIIC